MAEDLAGGSLSLSAMNSAFWAWSQAGVDGVGSSRVPEGRFLSSLLLRLGENSWLACVCSRQGRARVHQ